MESGVEGVALLTIFVLSAFTGYEVISKVSTVLHTPLLSGANAITGVVLVGAVMVAGDSQSTVELVLALVAVTLAAATLVGGFTVTDRMLHMFTAGRPRAVGAGSGGQSGQVGKGSTARPQKALGRAETPVESAGGRSQEVAGSEDTATTSERREQPSGEQGGQRDE